MTTEHRLKMQANELSPEARERYAELLLGMLQVEVNKKQTNEVYVHFPGPVENKEAAKERGLQGMRIEEIDDLLKRLGVDTTAPIETGMHTVEGTADRPAMFQRPLEDWHDFLVFRYLRDRARACWALGYIGADWIPFGVAIARLFLHAALGDNRPVKFARWSDTQLGRIGDRCSGATRQTVQAAITRWYPHALALLEAPDGEAKEVELGIRNRAAVACEKLFVETCCRELGKLGLEVPDSADRFAGQEIEPIYLDGADLPTDYRAKLVKLCKMHLASEYTTAFLEALDPPTAEDIAEWTVTIQEEGEHGEGMVDIISDLGEDAQAVIDDMRYGEGKYLLDFFKVDIESWDEVGIMRWLSERAAGYQSLGALGSNYIPFAAWSARNYMDEGMAHAGIGKLIVQNAIEAGRRDNIQRLMLKRYPYVVDYFGNEKPNNEYIEFGIKVRPNRELRRRWVYDNEEDCAELGLQMPDDPLQGARTRY